MSSVPLASASKKRLQPESTFLVITNMFKFVVFTVLLVASTAMAAEQAAEPASRQGRQLGYYNEVSWAWVANGTPSLSYVSI